MSTPRPDRPDTAATDVVRWAAFSCVLVPVVLVWYGTSLAGAAGAALGLAAVTAACRILLRQSERGLRQSERGLRQSERVAAARTPSRATHAPMAEDHTPHRGRHGRSSSGAHRGGRHSGPSTPVD
ncbi:hypothetical protein [Streptomyces tailanensis]|uniref:hypothetical protein n=1 Tax=Streptomyces tailanensis TaxID=2569858 RepID=UPI00122E05BC|nr:hypothetical protein [Streptomyces tailanensis]